MDITIIGASDMFARSFTIWAVANGHKVTNVGPAFEKPEAFRKSVGAAKAFGRHEPLQDNMIFIALPFDCLLDVLQSYEPVNFKDKIVVDLTIPFDFTTFEPIHPKAGSAAQEITKVVDASVVKAFYPKFANALAATSTIAKEIHNILLAGDDDVAKRVVAKFFKDGGLHPLDVGPLRRAKELESLGYLHIAERQPNLLKLA